MSEIRSRMYIGLHAKYPLFVTDFNGIWTFSTNFRKKKSSNIAFHENRSSGSRVVPCGRTDRHDEANFTFFEPCIVIYVRNKNQQNASFLYCCFKLIHHHHKHQWLDPLIRSVSRVTAAHANASSVFQLFSFLVVCSGMMSKGFGFVAFFASVKASSVCIHLACLVCL